MLSKFHNLLTEVERSPSKNTKVELIRRALDIAPELGKLFELALSPYITFGVAKLPKTILPGETEARPIVDEAAFALLDRLARRELTGNAAQEAIGRFRGFTTLEQDEAFSRILLKDLRCGVSESSVNKARPGTVPVFSCQLAMSEMPSLTTLEFPIYAEPKWDGVRTIAIKRNGVVTLFSRNGLPFTNFVELQNALTAMPDNTVLDGEVVSPRGFAALMKRTKADTGKSVDVPIKYMVFDALPLTAWDVQKCATPLRSRRELAEVAVGNIANTNLVVLSRAVHCGNVEVIEEFYADQLALGLEGIMLKDPNGLYTFKRNKTWLKLKPFDTADLKVVGLIEGKGKYEGSLGALICEGMHHGKLVRTEVGSGFTDAERLALWCHPIPNLGGRTAEIRYQDMTLAQDSSIHSLRFPTFVRWRDDK